MFGYLGIALLAIGLFWSDPIIRAVAPSWVPEAPFLHRTPRPPINESLLAMEDSAHKLSCPPDSYTVHIFNKAPLILYIENFVSADERQRLLELSAPLYEPATITHDGGGSAQRNVTVRDSEVAILQRTDVVRCIEARARRLQGWRDDLWIERLRMQRYTAPTGHYGYHYDWSRSGAATGGWGRVSTLMVYVDDGRLEDSSRPDGQPTLVGGGTVFPRLQRRSTDSRWCQWIGCAGVDTGIATEDPDWPRDNTTGVVFKPVVGNGVFWENFKPDGTGRAYEETWHAGMRVLEGVKVGLNIWSWGGVD